MNERAKTILNFWFQLTSPKERFSSNKVLDQKIRSIFFEDYKKAINNKYDKWQNNAKECLALIIILDQFSRNLFRNNRKAFAMDEKAKLFAYVAINNKYLEEFSTNEILFFILPLIHSENLNDHIIFYKYFNHYFKAHPKYKDIKKINNIHTDIIKKFGRYPYRNKVLGRPSTTEEIDYLNTNYHNFFKV
tara:strand:- start:51 stop:620 length:570 start_codon:yes stop_codon:yes gene_type:complete